jgi:hypothetical protein
MHSPNWNDDEELMRDIGAALSVTPVDEQVLTAARMAYAWRTLDVECELAALLYDSRFDEAVTVRERDTESTRTLAFHGEGLGVEIELTQAGIEGQLIPARPGSVTLRTANGPYSTVTADQLGCFSIPSWPSVPMRLDCATDAGKFITVWIIL